MSNAPVFDIDPTEFRDDPYPVLKRMRAEAPIAFVPQFNRTLLLRRDDIVRAEPNIEVFSSEQPEGLMTVLMGHNMMRKDGIAHSRERKAIFPTVSPATVRDHWTLRFRAEAKAILAELAPLGGGDLFQDYATRLSARALIHLTGLHCAHWRDIDRWSQAMIDGIANYAGDPEVEARCHEATAAIDAAIDEMLGRMRGLNARDMLSTMREAGLPEEAIRANIKLAISGGQNEPRDVIAGAIWALLERPEQLQMVLEGKVSWMQVFEEFVRWLSPIGMSPRRIAQDAHFGGVDFEEGDDVFLMFNSGNRDEAVFADADRFDITRDAGKHIAFGAGPHFCAGAWASKALVADIALPMIFAALPDLRLDGEVRVGGWAFRGVLNLPCAW